MAFITRIDYSDNRQVKQNPETITYLSGTTVFGVPFSYLPTGVDLTTTATTQNLYNITSSFSGNSATTVFSWYDSRMVLANSSFSALTPSNSATTQNSGALFSANTSGTSLDGYNITLTYTGVSFDITPQIFVSLGGGNYSGTVLTTAFHALSAHSLDYTGKTIWADISGITRTNSLIIKNNAQVNYILTCTSTDGDADWTSITNLTGSTSLWSAGTGTNSLVAKNSLSQASGDNSLSEGYLNLSIGNYSHSEGNSTTASGLTSHAEGKTTVAGGLGSHAEGGNTYAIGDYSHAEGNATYSIGASSHSEGLNTTAFGDYSHAGGLNSIASGITSFVHGSASTANGISTIVLGDNITGNTSHYTYVESLNIKTVGAGPGTVDIGVDANGNVVNQASDIRLKENVNTIENALDKVLGLRGVTYNWINRESGGDTKRYGFIAQEVNEIVPELTFVSGADNYMGVQYKDITALLVEAIKELCGPNPQINVSYLNTQNITAEDNNIDLNFGGNKTTANGGGIRVQHAIDNDSHAEFLVDSDGNWVTNNALKAKSLIIPIFTPTSSMDVRGMNGEICMDEFYLYVKNNNVWKRIGFESF